MKQIRFLITIAIMLFTIPAFAGSPIISKSDVLKTLKSFDDSMPSKNIESVKSFLSDDVKIILDINTPNGKQRIALNKKQYVNITLDAWSKMNPNIPHRIINDVEINEADNSAIVKCITTEIVEMNGNKVESKSKEILKFIVIDGSIKLVGSYSEVGI